MDWIRFMVVIGCLGAASIWDYRTGTIPWTIIAVLIGGGMILHGWDGSLFSHELLLALLPGTGLWLYSILSGGKLGDGDAMLITGMGLWLSAERILFASLLSFVLAGFFALVLVYILRKNMTEIPFAPFLFGGSLLMYLGSGLC